jgi:ELWxxDGT repeat protein
MKQNQLLIVLFVFFCCRLSAQTYALTRGLPMAEISGTGTTITGLTNDNFVGPFNIGFDFSFWGTPYSQFYMGSNGLISFGSGKAGPYGTTIPNSDATNSILFANADLNCSRDTPTINYFVSGFAPNRILVVNFKNVQLHNNFTNRTSVQIQLFETSNKIEIHSTNNVSGGYSRTIGVENNDGSVVVTEAALNESHSVNITNEMVRFCFGSIIPTITTSNNCFSTGSPVTLSVNNCTGNLLWSNGSNATSISVSPSINTIYSAICSANACPSNSSVEIGVCTPKLYPYLIKDIASGDFESRPKEFTAFNNKTYFRATTDGFNTYKVSLWETDGTTSGTKVVKEFASDSDNGLIKMNNTLFLSANDGINGDELWKSDGTNAGTTLVKDINPGSNNSYIYNMHVFNGVLYFMADNGTSGHELWRSDGTNSGTYLLKDINPGSNSSFDSRRADFTNAGNIMYFPANNGANGMELWKTDGTAAGTVMVKDIHVGSQSSIEIGIEFFTMANNILFFSAYNGINGRELWKSDGTTVGTVMVKDLNIANTTDAFMNIFDIIEFNEYVIVSANGELYKSDGTEAGTTLIKHIGRVGYPADIRGFVKMNNKVFFFADDNIIGYELWRTDGTEAGTLLVKDISPGSNGSLPTPLINVNDNLIFTAETPSTGREFWQSNGTTLGTTMIEELIPGPRGIVQTAVFNINSQIFFSTNTDENSYELFKFSTCPTNLVVSSPDADFNTGLVLREASSNVGTIIATNKITNTANVTYRAGKSITLNAGFKADNGVVFKTEFGGCN